MTTFTTTSLTSGGALPTGVTEIGGVVIDLIGLNGARVVAQMPASSLFTGFYDGGTPTSYQGNPGTIGVQTGFDPALLSALGGGIAEVAIRVTLFDGDTAVGNFDENDNQLLLNGFSVGNFSSIATQQTSSDGLTALATENGFQDNALNTGWFYSNDPTVLSNLFSSLSSGGVLQVQLSDIDPYDNFFDFTQGIDGGLVNVGQPPVVTPPPPHCGRW